MSSLLERLSARFERCDVFRTMRPEAISRFFPGWIVTEITEEIGGDRFHSGWRFSLPLKRSTVPADFSAMNSHCVSTRQSYGGSASILFAEHGYGWVVSPILDFKIGRLRRKISFVGRNGTYEISGGGRVHVFKPADGSKRERVVLNRPR